MSGSCYAVCNQGNYNSVKIGFTTCPVVEAYLDSQYSRSLHPLEVLFVIPAAKARLQESMLHHLLAPYRLHDRHELFDLSSQQAMRDLEEAKRWVLEADAKSRLPVPPSRPVNLLYWKAAKQAAVEGAKLMKVREERRQAELLVKERQRVKEERQRAKAEEDRRARDAKQAAKRRKREEREMERQNENDDGIHAFGGWLSVHVQRCGGKQFVRVCDLYAAFGAEKNYKKLDRELERCLGLQHFKAKHQVKIQGKNITTGKVYMGYRLVT